MRNGKLEKCYPGCSPTIQVEIEKEKDKKQGWWHAREGVEWNRTNTSRVVANKLYKFQYVRVAINFMLVVNAIRCYCTILTTTIIILLLLVLFLRNTFFSFFSFFLSTPFLVYAFAYGLCMIYVYIHIYWIFKNSRASTSLRPGRKYARLKCILPRNICILLVQLPRPLLRKLFGSLDVKGRV